MLTLRLAALLSTVVSSQILPWVKVPELSKGLPKSIQILTLKVTNSTFGNLTGAMVRIDTRDNDLEFRVDHTDEGQKPKTPMEFAVEHSNMVYAAINGGYFDMIRNVTQSLIVEDSKVHHPNTWNLGANEFPTVGAFGLANNTFSAEYVYCFANAGSHLETYRFQTANPVPGPAPTKQMGSKWQPSQAIGAGPILIKNGNAITGNLENFPPYIMDMRHPRSVIAVDRQGRLLLIAIDGRYEGSNGLTIAQLTEVVKELECQDAMNLDGGGSTLLFANNMLLNRPSEASGPRPVVSAVLVADRHQEKRTGRGSHLIDLHGRH